MATSLEPIIVRPEEENKIKTEKIENSNICFASFPSSCLGMHISKTKKSKNKF